MTDINSETQFCNVTSFADDTRVMKVVKSIEDRRNMQRDLENIHHWADSNNMMFNSAKFELIRYTIA